MITKSKQWQQNRWSAQRGLFLWLSIVLLFVVMTTGDTHATPKKQVLAPDHQEFYKYATYLFTKNERKIFLNLPSDKAREDFIRYFWEIRDPNPLTEENEFKVEIEQRFDYVSKYLKEGPIPGWKTDRGRLYILLGSPTNVLEQSIDTSFGRELYWYFADSDIFARFVDTNGTGVFRLDLNMVSLKLLDELEKRKYYIVNKTEKDNFLTELINFSLTYDKTRQEIVISLDNKHISYEKEPETNLMVAKIKVSIVIYDHQNNFFDHSEVKTLKRTEAELLEKNATLTLTIPLVLPKGKVKIDAIISDFLGDAVQRKFVTINN